MITGHQLTGVVQLVAAFHSFRGLRYCERTGMPAAVNSDTWVAAAEAGPDVRAELRELLTRARIAHRVWGEDYRCGSIAATQAQIGELEAEATVIREYQPTLWRR